VQQWARRAAWVGSGVLGRAYVCIQTAWPRWPLFGRQTTLNVAIYYAPMSSISAGQQRYEQVAGVRDTVYGSDDHTRPVVLAEACAEEGRGAAARAPSVGWPPTWRPTTVVGMGSSTDLLSLIIATLAVGLALITAVLQRRQQQREAYLGIYEVLMSEQLQRGRWLVSEISRHGDLPKDRSEDSYLSALRPCLARERCSEPS
jgi:hypothetical protein